MTARLTAPLVVEISGLRGRSTTLPAGTLVAEVDYILRARCGLVARLRARVPSRRAHLRPDAWRTCWAFAPPRFAAAG